MKDFKKLKIWQNAIEIAVMTYSYARLLPLEKKFELASQMRRACTSISNNISEGSAYETPKAFKNYLRISLGSCFEMENLFVLIQRLYPDIPKPEPELLKLIQTEQKMIIGLMKSLDWNCYICMDTKLRVN